MNDVDSSLLVSIVINCYNGEKYLSKTIDSIFKQTYENWEIIFWDNQSTDASAKIIQSYSDDRIKYFQSVNYTPLGEARNMAIEKTSGEWCAFLDSDDIWVSDKLEKQIDIVNKDQDAGVVYGQMLVNVEDVKRNSLWSKKMSKYTQKTMMKDLPEGGVFNQLLKVNFTPLLTAIFKRDLFLSVGGVSEHMEIAEDYDLFLKLSCLTKFRAVQDVVAYYRVHDRNTSLTKQEKCFTEILEIINRYLPNKAAVSGLKMHNTVWAIYKIRSGEVVKGLNYFIQNGSVNSLAYLVKSKFF